MVSTFQKISPKTKNLVVCKPSRHHIWIQRPKNYLETLHSPLKSAQNWYFMIFGGGSPHPSKLNPKRWNEECYGQKSSKGSCLSVCIAACLYYQIQFSYVALALVPLPTHTIHVVSYLLNQIKNSCQLICNVRAARYWINWVSSKIFIKLWSNYVTKWSGKGRNCVTFLDVTLQHSYILRGSVAKLCLWHNCIKTICLKFNWPSETRS